MPMVEYDTICRLSKYGGGGIRTHGALADTLVFKTRALNHSTTPPGEKYLIFSFLIISKDGWNFRNWSGTACQVVSQIAGITKTKSRFQD